LLLAVPLLAHAELSNETLIGPGLRSRPAFDGLSSRHLELVPVLRYFGQPWFVRSTQGVLEGGLRTELWPEFHGALQLAYEPGRSAGDDDFLAAHRVADLSRGASLGAQLEWDHRFGRMPITVLTRLRQHTRSERGAQADLRVSAGVLQAGRVSAGVFTQLSWANARSTQALYGVTPQQSALGGLPAYGASGGLLAGSAGLLYGVDLTPDWVVVGSVEARRLQASAARSPLAPQPSTHYASIGLAYRYSP
jgi:outer membrane scaffolding protein for murein synthesis (MipA/OmpV family)